MITERKLIELFCMADDFCKFFRCNDGKIYAKTPYEAHIPPCFNPVKDGNNAYHDTFPQKSGPLSNPSTMNSKI